MPNPVIGYVILTFVMATSTMVAACLVYRQSRANSVAIQNLHKDLNSRLTQLLEASIAAAHSEGIEAGRAQALLESTKQEFPVTASHQVEQATHLAERTLQAVDSLLQSTKAERKS